MSVLLPNMNLIVSTIGVDSGLNWETNLNADLTILDNHNHTPGNGVPIPSVGLNINDDLSFNNYQAINIRSILFTDQSSLSTVNALYTVAGELYYNDPTGAVQITLGGSVNATSSGISSGSATASFSSGVLVVNSAANTPANIRVASILLGNNVAASNYLTLSPPSSMAANISQTLPTIPAATSFVTMDSSGNFGTPVTYPLPTAGILDGSVTPAKKSALGQQISSSATASTGSSSFVDITNASITITTTGRPVFVGLLSSGTNGSLSVFTSGGALALGIFQLLKGATVIAQWEIGYNLSGTTAGSANYPPSLIQIDTPIAGTYTYKFQYKLVSGTSVSVTSCHAVAYEL